MRDAIAAQEFAHVEAFRAGIKSICGAYHVEPCPRGSGFAARAGLARVGGLEIARVALTAREVRRDARAIRRDEADHFVLTLQRRGEAQMLQGEHQTTLRAGDMFLSDAALPSLFDFGGAAAEQLSVHLPRAEMTSRFGALARGGLSIRREDSLAVAMTALLQRAQEETPPQIDEAFLSLVGAWLQDTARGETRRDARADGLLGQALTLINLHYRDPDFGPGALAELLNVAPRRLQRAFAPWARRRATASWPPGWTRRAISWNTGAGAKSLTWPGTWALATCRISTMSSAPASAMRRAPPSRRVTHRAKARDACAQDPCPAQPLAC